MKNLINAIVVEDDANMLFFIENFIKHNHSYRLLGNANTIQQAKVIIAALKPDLLFLDNFLPDGKGIDLLKYLRISHPSIDVILITAANDIDTIKIAFRHGVFDYLIKPFMIDRLNESLTNYLIYSHQYNHHQWQQQDIDKLFHANLNHYHENGLSYPKGIDKLTLLQVCAAFHGQQTEHSAGSLGKCIGISKSTARRYLEYCKQIRMLEAHIVYGAVGRPERIYRLTGKMDTH
ncbi:response regulator [Enterobacteriaceae bacterium ESL0689]|nr:response regulator [Enterobacteriaceae bacterium ESL0689]